MPPKEQVNPNSQECVGITLEPNEELYLVVRKHWIILVGTFIYVMMLGILCLGIYLIGNFASIPSIFTLLTVIGMAMVGVEYIFVQWVNKDLDILIVTNRRIISFDQVRFLDRKMSQTTIDLVQEVSSSTTGLLGNIFSYGDLMIKTASDTALDHSDFHISQIPDPIGTSKMIHSYIDEFRHSLDNSDKSGQK